MVCALGLIRKRYLYLANFYHCILDWKNSKVVLLAFGQLAFFLPWLVLVLCNAFILKAVLKSRRFLSEHAAASSRNVGLVKQHRTSVLTITIIVVFLLQWLPYCVAGLSLAVQVFSLPKEFMFFAFLLAISNVLVNPIIYGVMNKNFRVAFRKILC